MKRIADIMTRDVQVIEPQDTLRRAAELMAQLDVGSLPVCNGRRLLGVITDRDIVVRGVAVGLGAQTGCVSDAMTAHALHCKPGQAIDEALKLMGEQQVRRLPVIDDDGQLVGIVSLGDLALVRPRAVVPTVGDISEK